MHIIAIIPTTNNSVEVHYSDGTIRHNVGSDELSDEDRAAEAKLLKDYLSTEY